MGLISGVRCYVDGSGLLVLRLLLRLGQVLPLHEGELVRERRVHSSLRFLPLRACYRNR